MVSKRKALVNTERQEVTEVTTHDFRRKKDGLELVKITGEKTGRSTIRRRVGWSGEKQE